MNRHMVKRFIYSCLWNVAYACICILWLLSCEDNNRFEALIGNWYNSDIGYICFRNDGTGFIQKWDFILKKEWCQRGYFVYRHEQAVDSLIFLQFVDDGFKDTLKLKPIALNEIAIDGITYLRVKDEPVLQSEICDNDYE